VSATRLPFPPVRPAASSSAIPAGGGDDRPRGHVTVVVLVSFPEKIHSKFRRRPSEESLPSRLRCGSNGGPRKAGIGRPPRPPWDPRRRRRAV